jgi:hypothetical protein
MTSWRVAVLGRPGGVGRRRACGRRLRAVARSMALVSASVGLSGCLLAHEDPFGLDVQEASITITGPWSSSPFPAVTAGSAEAVFRLVGQSLGDPSWAGWCAALAVTFSFVDANTGQRIDVRDDKHRVTVGPGGCTTSSKPASAPRARLPKAFDDDRPHTVTVYAELGGCARRNEFVDSRGRSYKPFDCVRADGQVTVRVAPRKGVPPPVTPPPAAPPLTLPPAAPIGFGAPVSYPTAQHAVAVAAADLHLNPAGSADRRIDVAVSETPDSPDRAPSRLEVLRSTPDGSLSTYGGPYQFPVASFQSPIIAANLHGDRSPDLATVDYDDTVATVLRNDGNGTFDVPGTSYPVQSHPEALASGEVCGSGAPDLLTTSAYSGDVTLLCNNGDGTLQTARSFPAGGTDALAVQAADLNGDGHADIIVSNGGTQGTITVLRNSVTPGLDFAAPQAISSYTRGLPARLAIGDLNDDGKPDIAAAIPEDNTVSVLLNTTPNDATSFSFTEHTYALHGYLPDAVSVGDFNGDGHLDIATANYGSDNASVFQGHGDGTFDPPLLVGAGIFPEAIAAADLTATAEMT